MDYKCYITRLPISPTSKLGSLVAYDQWQRAGEFLGLNATTSSKALGSAISLQPIDERFSGWLTNDCSAI